MVWDNWPLSRVKLVAAWYRGEADAFGLAAVAADEQTADDFNCLRALKTKIEDNGGTVTDTMGEEARSASGCKIQNIFSIIFLRG